MRYMDTTTGNVYNTLELVGAYDMFRGDMENDHGCFDNWFEAMLQNGQYERVEEEDLMENKALVKKLYDHLGISTDGLANDVKCDFLTQNEGRDGKRYLWYMDSGKQAVIDAEGNVIDDYDKIDELFC